MQLIHTGIRDKDIELPILLHHTRQGIPDRVGIRYWAQLATQPIPKSKTRQHLLSTLYAEVFTPCALASACAFSTATSFLPCTHALAYTP